MPPQKPKAKKPLAAMAMEAWIGSQIDRVYHSIGTIDNLSGIYISFKIIHIGFKRFYSFFCIEFSA